ncbi:MAG: helix-turn-helix transcriptional regulator [Defluviitaleaceae bacterium]|nr:helix-turn-helix transcriptional regulator [Defluviitaleaceae bacterium]
MLSYQPFWDTLKRKKISTYALIEKHGISSGTIDRIRKGGYLTLRTVDDLCGILGCGIEEIVVHVAEDDGQKNKA